MNPRSIWLGVWVLCISSAQAGDGPESWRLRGDEFDSSLEEIASQDNLTAPPLAGVRREIQGVPVQTESNMPGALLATRDLKDPKHFWKSGIVVQLNGRRGYAVAIKDPDEKERERGYYLGIYFDEDKEPIWAPITSSVEASNDPQKSFFVQALVDTNFLKFWKLGEVIDTIDYAKNPDLVPIRLTDRSGNTVKEFTAGQIAMQIQGQAPKLNEAPRFEDLPGDKREYQLTYAQNIRVRVMNVGIWSTERKIELAPDKYTLVVTTHRTYKHKGQTQTHFDWAYFPAESIQAGDDCVKYWKDRSHYQPNFPYAVCINAAHQAEVYALPAWYKKR